MEAQTAGIEQALTRWASKHRERHRKNSRTMEERAWTRRDEREMQFTVRHSSRDRFWTGFVATIYDASDGFDETLFVNHSVSMHVGTPVLVTSRCDGAVLHRFQIPGDIKIVPAGFSRIWEAAGPTTKLSLNVNPALMRSAAEAMGVGSDCVSLQPQLQLRDPHIEHIAWALKAELETTEPLGRLYADSLGLALAAHLLRRYAATHPRRVSGGLSKRRLQRVTDYICEHLADDLTLAELADVADASPSHFKLLFKRSVGLPVHQYVLRTRVECATRLLLRGNVPLSEVALQAGFANQSHMALCVRRATGLTPSALRRAI
jgi:AraC family transcriptional regulator